MLPEYSKPLDLKLQYGCIDYCGMSSGTPLKCIPVGSRIKSFVQGLAVSNVHLMICLSASSSIFFLVAVRRELSPLRLDVYVNSTHFLPLPMHISGVWSILYRCSSVSRNLVHFLANYLIGTHALKNLHLWSFTSPFHQQGSLLVLHYHQILHRSCYLDF